MLKAAILGYGGIARAHRKGYEHLAEQGAPVELVALCDINPKQFEKIIAINLESEETKEQKKLNCYTDFEEMLKKEQPDIIDICLPTFLHAEYAIKAMKAGCHVLSEKPMGLNAAQCKEMIAASKAYNRELMIGMCLRFEPCYVELKKMIDDGRFGKVKSAHFDRLGGAPRWAFENWYMDFNRCGGVIMDLHIHDIDFIRFAFGEPKSVSSITRDGCTKMESVNTRFFFDDDKIVVANAEWGLSKTSKFRMSFRVNFEEATVILEKNAILTVYPNEGEVYTVDLPKKDRMAEEIHCLARAVLGQKEDTISPENGMKTVALSKIVTKSAEKGGKIVKC